MREWALAFLFTQVVEMPLYLWSLRGSEFSRSERVAVAFGASMVTHPPLWVLVPLAGHDAYWYAVVAGEIAVFVTEGLWLSYFSVRRAFLWSLAANAASLFLGMASRALFGLP